jgi:hypothetical protein
MNDFMMEISREDIKELRKIVIDFHAKYPWQTMLIIFLILLVVMGGFYLFYSSNQGVTANTVNAQIAVNKNQTQQVSAPVNTASNSTITANTPIAINNNNYIAEKPVEKKINQEIGSDSRDANLRKLNEFIEPDILRKKYSLIDRALERGEIGTATIVLDEIINQPEWIKEEHNRANTALKISKALLEKEANSEALRYAKIAYHRWSDNAEIIANYADCLAANNSVRALFYFKDAIEAYRELASTKNYDNMLNVASNLYKLAVFKKFLGTQDNTFDSTIGENLHQALEIYLEFQTKKHDDYANKIIDVLSALGTLYSENGDVANCRYSYEKALEIARNRAKKNPEEFLPQLKTTLEGAIYAYSSSLNYENQQVVEKLKNELEVVTKKLEPTTENSASE